MKFEYLKEFIVAAQADELQHSAKELGISPSVMSKHIKALENELGVSLFERNGKTNLSKYGTIFLQYAKKLVKLQNEFYSRSASPSAAITPELSIGITSDAFRESSGIVIEQMLQDYSERIKICEYDNSMLTGLVADGTIDIAFVRSLPVLERNTSLVYMPFCRNRMVAVLSPSHELAHQDVVNIDDLRNETVFLDSANSLECKAFEKMCLACGVTPRINFASAYTIYESVQNCEGITLSCSAPAERVCVQNPLNYIPITPDIITFVDIVFKIDQLPEFGWHLIKDAEKRISAKE